MRQRSDGTIAEGSHGAGLRVTAARLTLPETVRDGDHLGVEAIDFGRCDRMGHNAPGDRLGHLALQVNCEALRVLTATGPFPASNRPAALPGSRDASGTTTTASCAGRTVSSLMSDARLAGPLPDRVRRPRLSVDEADVIHWGLCPGCSTARSS